MLGIVCTSGLYGCAGGRGDNIENGDGIIGYGHDTAADHVDDDGYMVSDGITDGGIDNPDMP